MKKINLLGFGILVGITLLTACSTSSGTNNISVIAMWQSEMEDYILSKHDTNNNLVYFFIKKENKNENTYAFIITDQMDESERMNCLVNYTMTRDIPGFQTTKESANWYNNYLESSRFNTPQLAAENWGCGGFVPPHTQRFEGEIFNTPELAPGILYSPVVIQDDYRGVSVAAFSLPKNVKKIWILVQNITMDSDRKVNNHAYPILDFEVDDTSTQYYLINASTGRISSENQTEYGKLLSKTTFYATQTGRKFQTGYIRGKGQGLQRM